MRISNREIHSSQKYEFRRTYEGGSSRANRTAKTTFHKTIEERPYKTTTKFVEVERNDFEKIKKPSPPKKQVKEMRPAVIVKKEWKK